MAVNRITTLHIARRGLFIALYGHVGEGEYFVDKDLRCYSLAQQLYLYLKAEGYASVVFYDTTDSFHSFRQQDLIDFLGLETEPVAMGDDEIDEWEIAGPLGRTPVRRNHPDRAPLEKPAHDAIRSVDFYGMPDAYFRTTISINLIDFLKRNLPSQHSCAVVIRKPESSAFEHADDYVTFFADLNAVYSKNRFQGRLQNKVIVVYGGSCAQAIQDNMERSPGYLFSASFFKDLFFQVKSDQYQLKPETTFQISLPDVEEVGNLLNRKRITNALQLFSGPSYSHLKLKLARERKLIKDLDDINMTEFINNFSDKNAWDALAELKGIENIIEQFRKQVNFLKKAPRGTGAMKVRPHMCFKGGPGTGKTTVARLIADILKEENVLELGQMIPVSAVDMIADHVGGTRIKTQAKCDEAKGGILFIDEAYGLMDQNFGKEAIEVLIQFMENNSDSLVILAGYEDDIERLLKEGNEGFSSRFVPSNHFIFHDYPPDVLCQIARSKLSAQPITENATADICRILALQFSRRQRGWGNARAVETLIQEVLAEFYCTNDELIDVNHIPPAYRQLINPAAASAGGSSNWVDQLNELTGLEKMKARLKSILNSVKADKIRSERSGKPMTNYKLNFIFRGTPGTGKTKVARLLGGILHDYGLLAEPVVNECHREDMIAGYAGQTAPLVKQRFKDAIGRVLFLDEVYSISTGTHDEFGQEATNAIVGNLTDTFFEGKMAVVIAGYSRDIDQFFSKNAGLRGRFNFDIEFDDYSNEELWTIFLKMAKDANLIVEPDCQELAMAWFAGHKRNEEFANARLCENLLSLTKHALDNRISLIEMITDEVLYVIIKEDLPNFQETI